MLGTINASVTKPIEIDSAAYRRANRRIGTRHAYMMEKPLLKMVERTGSLLNANDVDKADRASVNKKVSAVVQRSGVEASHQIGYGTFLMLYAEEAFGVPRAA